MGLRNPGHSVVKLMQPCQGASLVVSSYTHPAYARVHGRSLRAARESNALLCAARKAKAWPTRAAPPQVDGFVRGERIELQAQQAAP